MNATSAVGALLRAVPDGLFVASLGTATSALRSASDDGPHLYLGGAMGSAMAAAIGVAERKPEVPVVAVLGDGETLMGAGSLWTLAGVRPRNLLTAVLADGHYTITGGQQLGVPMVFAKVAQALGLSAAIAFDDSTVTERARSLEWPALLEMRYADTTWPGPSPFVDPALVRTRFEAAAANA